MNVKEVLERIRTRMAGDQEAVTLLEFILNSTVDTELGVNSLLDEIDTAFNG